RFASTDGVRSTPAAERAGSVRSGPASAPSVFWSLLLNGRHEAPPCRCAPRSGLVSDGAAQYEGKELGLRCELGCHCVSRNLWDWRRKAVREMRRNRRYERTSPRMARN